MFDDTFDRFEIGAWSADGMIMRTVTLIKNVGKTGIAVAALCAAGVADASSTSFQRGLADHSIRYVLESRIEEQSSKEFDAKRLTQPLKMLREKILEPNLIGEMSANREAIRMARIIAHQIDSKVTPSIGLDEDGSVFLHFVDDRKHAYLTIEADAYHLLCIVPGVPNTYIDGERLAGRKLPSNIKDKIASIFS